MSTTPQNVLRRLHSSADGANDSHGTGVTLPPSVFYRPAASRNTARRARGAASRLHRHAASATSCGILAIYFTWRSGLMRSVAAPMKSLSSSCWLTLRSVTGYILGLRFPAMPPQPDLQHLTRSNPLECASAGCGAAGTSGLDDKGHRIYSVRMVAMPPRHTSDPWLPARLAGAKSAAAVALYSPGLDSPTCQTAAAHTSHSGAAAGSASTTQLALTATTTTTTTVTDYPQQQAHPDISLLKVHLVDLRGVSVKGAASPVVVAALSQLADDLGTEQVVGLDAEWEPELQPGVRHR